MLQIAVDPPFPQCTGDGAFRPALSTISTSHFLKMPGPGEIQRVPPAQTSLEGKSNAITCEEANVGIAIINHPPNHHFYGWYKPSKIGGLLLLHPHYLLLHFVAGARVDPAHACSPG